MQQFQVEKFIYSYSFATEICKYLFKIGYGGIVEYH